MTQNTPFEKPSLNQINDVILQLLNTINDAIFFLDIKTGHILSGNDTCLKMLGCSIKEMQQYHFLDYQNDLPVGLSWERLVVELREDGALLIESTLKHRCGESLPVETSFTLISDYVVAICRDITVRKLAQKENVRADLLESIVQERTEDLKAANDKLQQEIEERKKVEREFLHSQKMEAIGKLAGGIAHDFNNYLTVINGYGEMLNERLDDGSQHQMLLKEILAASKDASNLTNQLLSVSRKRKPSAKRVNVNEVVIEMHKLLRHVIGEDVRLSTEFSSGSGQIQIDPEQLRQVVLNLMVNARDAMPQGGDIRIKTEVIDFSHVIDKSLSPDSYIVMSFKDSGVGMSAEVQERIFEPFFTTKGLGKGTGLGLSTVYSIVKQNGGHLIVGSEVGKGTVIDIYFPMARDKTEEAQTEVTPETPQKGEGTILLVDDESSLLTLYQSLLEEKGYDVITAENAERALDIFDERGDQIDLILTDIVMTGMTGVEMGESVTGKKPDMKIVYMSGYMDGYEQVKLAEANAEFLQKPFSNRALLHKIHDVIHGVS